MLKHLAQFAPIRREMMNRGCSDGEIVKVEIAFQRKTDEQKKKILEKYDNSKNVEKRTS